MNAMHSADLSLSALATAVTLAFTVQVGRQWWRRRRMYQLVWTAALGLFAVGVACQVAGDVAGWTVTTYRLWYLSGAILAAAVLGQGTVYLMVGRWKAHALMALLLIASCVAAVVVWQAPVDLPAALSGSQVSGLGMPKHVRLLTPFFNIYGTAALIGGALISLWRYLWNGGNGRRTAGTALIGGGAMIVATGGTLTRFGWPGALAIAELAGMTTIFVGFTLTARGGTTLALSRARLARRRWLVLRTGISTSLVALFTPIAVLPALPWMMGIVGNVKHVFTTEVPQENKGVYLVTDQGVMQLYSWAVEPGQFPPDAPTLDARSVQEVTIVLKAFDDPARYRLVNIGTRTVIGWRQAEQQGMHLQLTPEGTLPPGDYEIITPTDSMFGGSTWQYMRLR